MDDQQAYVERLRNAVFTVLEGWNLPADARKMLEAALWATPQPAECVPLTPEQIEQLKHRAPFALFCEDEEFYWIIRTVEAAHNIKPLDNS